MDTNTFKGMEIMHTTNNGNVIVCYSKFDMGCKYKIYVKQDGNARHSYTYCENSIIKAVNYANKIQCV